jgi:predicted membrane protein
VVARFALIIRAGVTVGPTYAASNALGIAIITCVVHHKLVPLALG